MGSERLIRLIVCGEKNTTNNKPTNTQQQENQQIREEESGYIGKVNRQPAWRISFYPTTGKMGAILCNKKQ